MPDEPGDLEGWLAELTRTAVAMLEDAVGMHPWLAGSAGHAGATVVAIGLATVDRERAVAGLGGDEWRPLERDPMLGASVLALASPSRGAPDDREPLVLLLEPDTEGPLAATLARFGEGLAAIYARSAGGWERPRQGGREAEVGPLGPAQLLPGPAWGPHVIALRPRDTIGR